MVAIASRFPLAPAPSTPGLQGLPHPGSSADFVVNVGDRVFFETDRPDLTPQRAPRSAAQWLPRGTIATPLTIKATRTTRHPPSTTSRSVQARPERTRISRLTRHQFRTHAHNFLRQRAPPVAVCDDISCWSQNRRSVIVLHADLVAARVGVHKIGSVDLRMLDRHPGSAISQAHPVSVVPLVLAQRAVRRGFETLTQRRRELHLLLPSHNASRLDCCWNRPERAVEDAIDCDSGRSPTPLRKRPTPFLSAAIDPVACRIRARPVRPFCGAIEPSPQTSRITAAHARAGWRGGAPAAARRAAKHSTMPSPNSFNRVANLWAGFVPPDYIVDGGQKPREDGFPPGQE